MASQVPYSGTTNVGAESQPIPTQHIDTPIAAFGGATAAAVSHLGETADKVGNELFSRAIAMQDLNNSADASKAAADYTTQGSDLVLKFRRNSGKNAVDQVPDFQRGVNDLRENIRNTLSSPMAQKLYDQESRRTQSSLEISAGTHAGEQLKHYDIEAADARIKSAQIGVAANANDEGFFQAQKKAAYDAIAGSARGMPDEAISTQQAAVGSSMRLAQIKSITEQGNPVKAKKIYDTAMGNGELIGDDPNKGITLIQSKMNSITSKQIASTINTGSDYSYGENKVSPSLARGAIAGNEQGSLGYGAVGPLTRTGERALGKYQVMPSNLPLWLKEAGMDSMTPAEFLTDPSAQDKLFDFKFGQFQDQYGSFNRAASAWFTGKPDSAGSANDRYHTNAWYLSKANTYLANNATLTDKVTLAKDRAEKIDPMNPTLVENSMRQTETQHNLIVSAQKQDYQNNIKALNSAAAKFTVDNDGKLPTSEAELLTTPEAHQAWERLGPDKQAEYQKVFSTNAKGGYAETPENARKYMELRGALENPNPSPDERDKLLEIDPMLLHMSNAHIESIRKLQNTVFKGASANPNIGRAMTAAAPILSNMQFDYKDKTALNTFKGMFSAAISEQMEDTNVPLKDGDYQKIATRLLTQEPTGHGIFLGLGTAKDANYNNERQKIQDAWNKNSDRPGYNPITEDQILQIYKLKLSTDYQNLHGKTKLTNRVQ